MKKTLIVVVAAIVVIGVGFLVSNHYQTNQPREEAKVATQSEVNKLQEALTLKEGEKASLEQRLNVLRIACERGQAIHNQAPTYLQVKHGPINCNH